MVGPPLSAVGELGVVRERLVVKLKQRVGVAQDRGVPTARVPGPGHVLLAESVANSRCGLLRDE